MQKQNQPHIRSIELRVRSTTRLFRMTSYYYGGCSGCSHRERRVVRNSSSSYFRERTVTGEFILFLVIHPLSLKIQYSGNGLFRS